MRTKTEELALRRSQLERRRARLLARTAATKGHRDSSHRRSAAHEQAHRAALEEMRAEKVARAAAERRSNEMALRALEAERTKRLEAEKLLEIERVAGRARLLGAEPSDRRKFGRHQAATRIQAHFRGKRARQEASQNRSDRFARKQMASYLRDRAHRDRMKSLRPTGIQREFVVEAGDADLDFQLASDLSIQSVAAGGKSERAGVCVGMRLCSFQGQSTLAVPYRDLICRMAHTPRPWMFVVEDMHHPEHTGPTVFQLAQHIKADLGLDISLGVVEAVAQACEELHLSATESLQEQVLACCRELHIDVGSQAHEQVPRGQANVGERGMATQLNTLECVFSQSDLPLELDFSESLVVARVAAGGPADRAGVKTGMQLTHFQGEDLRGASFEESIERMGATLEAHWRMRFAQQ